MSALDKWQPIETAPKDGTPFLARWTTLGPKPRTETIIAYWSLDPIWRGFHGKNISSLDGTQNMAGVAHGMTGECLLTDWMPLPEPPK